MAPSRTSSWRSKDFLFALIGVLYAYVLWTNERFLFDAKDPEWGHIATFQWWLLPHGLAAACALFLGPLQFSDRLRLRYAKVHRVLGRIYIAGAFVGAPLGIYIQHFEERMGSPRSFTIATVADGGLWMFVTAMALWCILQKKTQLHRQWMTRSFALALVFVEVRVVIGLTGWEKYVEAIVWACVACAVPLADLVLYVQESRRARPRTVSA